jgi:hypothetical protein
MVTGRWVAVLLVVFLSVANARAQGTSGPRVADGAVGYIDTAIPGDVFRFRFDASFDFFRATRAEFIYPQAGPRGPGLAVPEPRVTFEELSAYIEVAASDRLSGFLNLPVRFLQPEVNPDHAGFSDLDAGFKFAFIRDEAQVATFQFRTYVPTGNSHLGLGTHHVSLEPALLHYGQLTDRLACESELRLWVPVGGTDFAGNIVRYGVGLHYDVYRTPEYKVTPVVELIGWTVLNGKESSAMPSGVTLVQNAGGDTILNAKFGVRVGFGDVADMYVGYGHPLTGDRWYENTVRVEFRLFY